MTIRCIYHDQEPSFPATAQHPDAVRYKIGEQWVDAVGGKPTQADVDAILTPSKLSAELTVKDLQKALLDKGVLMQNDLDNVKLN